MNFTLLIRSWWVHKYALYTQLVPPPPKSCKWVVHSTHLNSTIWHGGFLHSLASSCARRADWADSYTCPWLLHKEDEFLCLLASSYACWQVLMLVGKFLRLLASSYTISGFRWYDAPQDEALSRFWPALSSRHPMGSKPLFQEMPRPLGLTYHITMRCNVGIPYSNVMDCQETPHWLLFYPKSRNLSKCNLTSNGVRPPNLTNICSNFY